MGLGASRFPSNRFVQRPHVRCRSSAHHSTGKEVPETTRDSSLKNETRPWEDDISAGAMIELYWLRLPRFYSVLLQISGIMPFREVGSEISRLFSSKSDFFLSRGRFLRDSCDRSSELKFVTPRSRRTIHDKRDPEESLRILDVASSART